MIVRYSIKIKQKNKPLQKIKSQQRVMNIPRFSKDIHKKLSISNFMTPKHITLAELTKKHHDELSESMHTMIKIYFTQIETFSNDFYKVVDNNNSNITKDVLKVRISLLSDTIKSISFFSFGSDNNSTQSIFDTAISKLHNELNKLIEMIEIKNMHSLTPIKGKIRCELKEILSKIILISQTSKKEIDKLSSASTEL